MTRRPLLLLSILGLTLLCNSGLTAQWTQFSGPYGGNIEGIMVEDSLVLASVSQFSSSIPGGVYKSSDGGRSWKNVGLTQFGIRSFLRTKSCILAGSVGLGLYRSSDEGNSWSYCALEMMAITSMIQINNRIYAALPGVGIEASNNDGTTWQLIDDSEASRDIQQLMYDGSWIYSVGYTSGIRRCTKIGQNWEDIGFADQEYTACSVQDGRVFAAFRYKGLYQSDDHGLHWTSLGLGDFVVSDIAVHDSCLYVACNRTGFKSCDGGANWSPIPGLPDFVSFRYIVFHGSQAFCTTQTNGIYRSDDGAHTWINCGLPAQLIGDMLMVDSVLIAGTIGDGYGIARSSDAGLHWTECNTIMPFTNVRSFVQMGSDLYSLAPDVCRSRDTGRSWTVLPSGIGEHYLTYAYRLLSKDGLLFCNTLSAGVLMSPDSGLSWSQLNSGLTNLEVYELFASSKGTLYAGCTNGAVFRSDDNAQQWSTCSLPNFSNIVDAFAQIGNTVFTASRGDGVARTIDGGQSWTSCSSGLDDLYITDLAANDSYIFAATQTAGVYYSSNKGDSWQAFNKGLADSVVFSLMIHGNTLYAGTIGCSIFHCQIPGTSSDVATNDIEDLELKLSPNPVHQYLQLSLAQPLEQQATVRLYDAQGCNAGETPVRIFESGQHLLRVDTSTLADGVYTIVLQAGRQLKAMKFAVMH